MDTRSTVVKKPVMATVLKQYCFRTVAFISFLYVPNLRVCPLTLILTITLLLIPNLNPNHNVSIFFWIYYGYFQNGYQWTCHTVNSFEFRHKACHKNSELIKQWTHHSVPKHYYNLFKFKISNTPRYKELTDLPLIPVVNFLSASRLISGILWLFFVLVCHCTVALSNYIA